MGTGYHVSECTTGSGPAPRSHLQLIQNTPRKGVNIYLSPDVKRSICDMLFVHFRTIQYVSRHHKLPHVVIHEVMLEGVRGMCSKAEHIGYLRGLAGRGPLPPAPPFVGMGRAA